MKIAEGAATEAGKQAFEKVKGLLTPQLQEKVNRLSNLLRLKSPQTVEAIQKAPHPPLNIDITENELNQAIQKDSELGTKWREYLYRKSKHKIALNKSAK